MQVSRSYSDNIQADHCSGVLAGPMSAATNMKGSIASPARRAYVSYIIANIRHQLAHIYRPSPAHRNAE